MLDLYTYPTTSGRRAAIALEEAGLAYSVHKVDIMKGEQRRPEFLALNPFGHIPVLVDTDEAGHKAVLADSAAILLHAAKKGGGLIPEDPVAQASAMSWALFGASTLNGAFSSYLKFAVLLPERNQPMIDMYEQELMKLLDVLDRHFDGREYVIGAEYTIADISMFPPIDWVAELPVGLGTRPNLQAWWDRVSARAAVQRGRGVAA